MSLEPLTLQGRAYSIANVQSNLFMSLIETDNSLSDRVFPAQGLSQFTNDSWWYINSTDGKSWSLRNGNLCSWLGPQGTNVVGGVNNNASFVWNIRPASGNNGYIIGLPDSTMNIDVAGTQSGTNLTLLAVQPINATGGDKDLTQIWKFQPVNQKAVAC